MVASIMSAPRKGPSDLADVPSGDARRQPLRVGGMVMRVRSAYRDAIRDALEASGAAESRPIAAEAAPGQPLAFLSRCIVLQAIGAAGIVGLWIAGIANKPFESENAVLCWLIVGMAALGILCV